MKILVISYSLPPNGGAEKVAWDIAKEYSKKHEVNMMVFGKNNSYKIIDGIKINFFKFQNRSFLYYLFLGKFRILKKVNEINPDIIHSHSPTIFSYVIRKLSYKKIITFHHSESEKYNWKIKRRLIFNFFEKECIENYDFITTVSKRMKEYFEKKYNIKINHIPNGINNKVFYDMKIQRNNNSIIYIGQLTKAKGVDKIFHIAKKLKNYTFIFIGDGNLKNMVNYDNIKFIGKKNSKEISKYLNESKFALYPSKYENFPLVGLEAMACGVIVISTKMGFSEYIDHNNNGYIIDFNDYDELKILLNENNRNIQINAIESVKSFYLNKISNKYINLF